MKYLIFTIIFTTALFFGIGLSNLGNSEEDSMNQCSGWEGSSSNQELFTLDEAQNLSGKKVVTKTSVYRPEKQIGRIIHIEMVANDKFFVGVNWSENFEDDFYQLAFHDKTTFEEHLELID